jgi:hypothetical protein
VTRVFLISPVRLDGVRGHQLRHGGGALAKRLRTREGVPVAEAFAYVSGLYFRGKLSYARTFARPPAGSRWLADGALVITANRGLVPADSHLTLAQLEAFVETAIDADEPGFTRPLLRDAARLAEGIGETGEVVLLGSVATAKYVAPLVEVLGSRLVYPASLKGLGDMSRGALLLRAARSRAELEYAPADEIPALVRRRARRP